MKIGSYMLWAATAVGTGVIVLLGYFVQLESGSPTGLMETIFGLRLLIIRWAVLLAAVGLLLGLVNLFSVHWRKVSEQEQGWTYSTVLILTFFITLLLGLVFGPDHPIVLLLFNGIQTPVEASLGALLAITLTLAGFRTLQRRRDLVGLAFIITALLVLLGSGPGLIPNASEGYGFFSGLRNWLAQVAAAGGARGVLLGVALGSVVTGLRVLLAMDRPYGD